MVNTLQKPRMILAEHLGPFCLALAINTFRSISSKAPIRSLHFSLCILCRLLLKINGNSVYRHNKFSVC